MFPSLLLRLLALSLVLLGSLPATAPAAGLAFQFTLETEYRTSAAVYDKDGKLVRTLWRGVRFEPGAHNAAWDGLDDAGNPCAQGMAYTVKVLANNVRHIWEGVIGNTSASFTGEVYSNPHAVVATDACYAQIGGNTYMYFTNGSAEGGAQAYRFLTTDPQRPQTFAPLHGLGFNGNYGLLAADEDWLYAANQGGGIGSTFVRAWTLVGEQAQQFSAGTAVRFGPHRTLPPPDLDPQGYFVLLKCADVDGPTPGNPQAPAPKPITGLAVQRGNDGVLAVARSDYNRVDLLNKRTGALLTSFAVTAPTRLAFNSQDQLWVIGKDASSAYRIFRYQIGRASGLGSSSTIPLVSTISTVAFPLALSVSPADNSLLVTAGERYAANGTLTSAPAQQVLRFDAAGAPLSPAAYGQAGGYRANGPDVAAIPETSALPTRFQFHMPFQPNDRWTATPPSLLAALPDGSFWVSDGAPQYGGTSRLLHVSSALAATEQISFMVNSAAIAVDKNNPTRAFWDYLEFEVDYTKSLKPGDPMASGGNQSWKLKKNWGAGLRPELYYQSMDPRPGYLESVIIGFASVVTLGNGTGQRTYALAALASEVQDYGYYRRNALLELPATGPARDTGIVISDKEVQIGEPQSRAYKLQADGSLRYGLQPGYNGNSGAQEFRYLPFQGLVSSGGNLNPSWGVTFNFLNGRASSESGSMLLGTTPITTAVPIWPGNVSLPLLPSGRVVVFGGGATIPGFHLGIVYQPEDGATGFRSLSSPRVPAKGYGAPPGDGSFEVGYNNGATEVQTAGNHIVYGFRAEFYNGVSNLAQQWMHFYDEGLFVGQFGTQANAVYNGEGDLASALAGAAASFIGVTTTVNQEHYLYTNDDGNHAGLNRWRLAGAEAMKLYEGDGSPGGDPIALAGHGLAGAGTLQAPLDLRGGSKLGGTIELTWAPVPGASSYEVRYGVTPDVLDQSLSVSASSNPKATISGLKLGALRYFAVRAIGSANSPWSHIVGLVPLPVNRIGNAGTYAGGQVRYTEGMSPLPMVLSDPVTGARQYPMQLHEQFEHVGTLLRTSVGSRGWVLFNPSQSPNNGAPDLVELRPPGLPSVLTTGSFSVTSASSLIGAGWQRFNGPAIGYGAPYGFEVQGYGRLEHCSLIYPQLGVPSPAVTIGVPDSRWRLLTVVVPTGTLQERNTTVTLKSLDNPGAPAASLSLNAPAPTYNAIVQFYFAGNVDLTLTRENPLSGGSGFNFDANLGAVFIDDLPTATGPQQF